MAKNKDPNYVPKRRHKPETIAKMSEKRRARTVQPRSGTSKKAHNLYQQLKKDYKGHPDEKEVLKWIEENKHLLNISAEETRDDWGIHCDYHSQYPGIYEIKTGSIIYGDKIDEDPDAETDPYELIENEEDNPFEI